MHASYNRHDHTLYSYCVNDQVFGPVSLQELKALLNSGQIPFSTTTVKRENTNEWVPLSTVLQARVRIMEAPAESKKEKLPAIRYLFYTAAWIFFGFGMLVSLFTVSFPVAILTENSVAQIGLGSLFFHINLEIVLLYDNPNITIKTPPGTSWVHGGATVFKEGVICSARQRRLRGWVRLPQR